MHTSKSFLGPINSASGRGCSAATSSAGRSRSLPVADQKRKFFTSHPPHRASQTPLSFAHTLNTGIVAFGAGLSRSSTRSGNHHRDKGIRATSSPRAGLEGQSCCPRHVQVSASSSRRAGLEGKHSYPRDGQIKATSLRRAGLEGKYNHPRDGLIKATS